MKRILIAGIGNIFLGDDAFGCEVARELASRKLAEQVRVVDFGIRSYDLAYALADQYEAAILIDAAPRGEPPGTPFLLEIGDSALNGSDASASFNPHSMNPVSAIQIAQSLGRIPAKMFLVGCEPAVLNNTTGEIGLSEEVRKAVPHALNIIDSLLEKLTKSDSQSEGMETEPVEGKVPEPGQPNSSAHSELDPCVPSFV